MKLQVPLRMPSMRSMRSPARPCSRPGITGNAARDGGSILEVSAFGGGQPFQFHAMEGDELLVGGDHALAGFERAPDPGTRGIKSADEFNNHVGIGAEHGVDILGPYDVRPGPVHALARHAAIENVGQFEARGLEVGENAGDGAAHGAETRRWQRAASAVHRPVRASDAAAVSAV